MDPSVTRFFDLAGQVALVTGAGADSGGSGIGEAIATVLARAGATVVVTDLSVERAETTSRRIQELGGKAVALGLDVSRSAEAEQVMETVIRSHGHLDILVNTAGIYRNLGRSLFGITDEMWHTLMAVNLEGVFYCSRAAARQMKAGGGGGSMVNIASVSGLTPSGGVAYDSSKAGVIQFTRTLAFELAPHGIRVNAIAPGPTARPDEADPSSTRSPRGHSPPETESPILLEHALAKLEHLPLRRGCYTGEHLGLATMFLCSPAGAGITGVCLPVDGGWMLL